MYKKERSCLRCQSKLGLNRINAQVSVFIILALVIVSGILLYFVLRDNVFTSKVPAELEPVYDYYLSCIENEVRNGAIILGEQGGYIKGPEFSPGSEYMPFSSYLGFMGLGIPYWYYVSGNGVKKEQMPSKEKMETELEQYIQENIVFCNFEEFENKGFEVDAKAEDVSVNVKIEENNIEVKVNQQINIAYGESSWTGKNHNKNVVSSLGKFYNLAKEIYLSNKESMFLEKYGIDVLRFYAPVDGTEISCVPKTWSVNQIRNDLIEALEANIPAIKIKGDYYNLNSEEDNYFVKDIGKDVDVNVNFIYSGDWPMKMEIWPSEGDVLSAEPVGTQEGLGMLGFCYVPYHFVYDFSYPVLIQIYSGNEFFQFPLVVFIDKNNPQEALDVEGLPQVVPELCEHKNTQITINTYNTNLEPVESEIKYKCFDTVCNIGKTQISGDDAILVEEFPQCVNGYVIASAEGYKNKKEIVSTSKTGSFDIILDKEYALDLELEGIQNSENNAIITFKKEGENSITLAYPEQKRVTLSQGQYEIQIYVYTSSNIKLEGSTEYKCVEVSDDGLSGIFGSKKENCYEFKNPEQTIEKAISGGGTQNYYLAESQLINSEKIVIEVNNFGQPSKVEDLQINYNQVKTAGLGVRFE